ncbi:hypothetical protein NQZ68_003442 [Dissostichus eleginoides]|uniref:Olfactory protein n=1 Tax=Dissostichus eleginoides TaxID=100907 RepID=A0AAD9CG66_DISEL|nr:hypothetical protein NQZ68_003442 [Dissostichus eleginoides]KAK1901810.1 Olfactory protein [Dissostichus eleginoides]
MKTLCVAALVLSLSSVCQPASLACEKLLQPVDKAPDLSGRWYVIALPTSCYLQMMARVSPPSFHVEVTSKETPHFYDFIVKAKIDGLCGNQTGRFFQENNKLFDVDSNNASHGVPDVLLQTGCPDCIVSKRDRFLHVLTIFSRRTNITAAELKEFETQAECLGLTKPQVLHSDHDFTNCRSEEDKEAMAIHKNAQMQRFIDVTGSILKCFAESSTVMGNFTSMPL